MTTLATTTADEYEARLVPAEMAAVAEHVLAVAKLQPGQRVLDLACGTGIVTRKACAAVAKDSKDGKGRVTGVDPNPEMLATARRLVPDAEFLSGSSDSVPCKDNSFDAAVCSLGMMFFPDKAKGVAEMARCVVPGGRVSVAVFAASSVYAALADVFAKHVGTEVGDALRAPFSSYSDEAAFRKHFSGALRDLAVTRVTTSSTFPSVKDAILADVRGWFPFAGFSVTDQQLEAVINDATVVLAPYTGEDGRIAFPLDVVIASGIVAAG